MAGGEGCRQEWTQTRPVGAHHDQQESRPERQVLEEIPEQSAAPAAGVGPEIPLCPKPLVQHGGRGTVAGDDQRAGPVGNSGDDAERAHDLDTESAYEHGRGKAIGLEHLPGLSHRVFEAQQLVEGAEG
jgi:hypothetical protein